MAYYVINYSKLCLWEFVEYSKMLYLDGDIQLYDNIDHLFDLRNGHFYAVMDCFCENKQEATPHNTTSITVNNVPTISNDLTRWVNSPLPYTSTQACSSSNPTSPPIKNQVIVKGRQNRRICNRC
ncbi:Glycogenin-2 [Gossypium arboreum]|uniref:Uncharacterized protein n=2 Tax=Gossypium arboreum TaxID=29729 RepID=A0ABR0MR63_GOSAR|nr:hypothetical protein PVK06_044269 [Gossypium arboreum]KHG08277.1 Glycogenin-2 [Gossypium arboreum]